LKTPLNIIFATAQLLSLNNSDNEKMNMVVINKYISTIKQNCYRLIRLINNLIDITKIDSGYIEFNPENRNIVEIIENITLSTAQYVESKNRTLIFDTDTEEKIMACDLEKLERIMLNLISNAIKFTSEGDKIEVTLSDKDDFVEISVKDNGIGIPYEKQKIIFERFKQVDPLLCRRHEGSGIGLSLVKALVEIHKGNIHLKSRYKKGSEFIISLPACTIKENDSSKKTDDFIPQNNVEKIQIEFSDIYN
jgi:signal transduction histidine kinase